MNITSIESILKKVKSATSSIRSADDDLKKKILFDLAAALEASTADIILQNQSDYNLMADGDPKKDRLLLNESRIRDLGASVRSIAVLEDPSGKLLSERILENGLKVQKISVPMGVVGIIYESRPNVTIDVAALCIRSGNACVLRGGTDALHSNQVLVDIIKKVLSKNGIRPDIVELLPAAREHVAEMLSATAYIDIIIPRGSQELIDFVRKNSSVPTIETGAGVCHTYVEKTADLKKAKDIVVNAKTSRPSVCNALDTIIVDKEIAEKFLPMLNGEFQKFNVEIFADESSFPILKNAEYPYLSMAGEHEFGREFLDYKCSVKVVENSEEAFEHIRKYSSKHSEAIVTKDEALSKRFLEETDAAAVFSNASTRFTDGGVFGLGAEIGISTQKLHARGPFALEKLVTEKWVIVGNGQVRQ